MRCGFALTWLVVTLGQTAAADPPPAAALPAGALARLGEVRLGPNGYELGGPQGHIQLVAFSADGKSLLAVSLDHSVSCWDWRAKKISAQPERPISDLWTAAVSPDGRSLVWGGNLGDLWTWEPGGAKRAAKFQGQEELRAIAFSPDGKLLITANKEGVIELRDWASRKKLRQIRTKFGEIEGLALSADGTVLAAGSIEGLGLWEAGTGKPIRNLPSPANSVCFSPDGKLLLTSSHWDQDPPIRLWEVATGKKTHEMIPVSNDGISGATSAVVFAPDGRTFASVDCGHKVRIWDVDTGKERRRFPGHRGRVWSVAFSPDGSTVASGSGDGTVLVWNVWGLTDPPARRGVGGLQSLWRVLGGEDVPRVHEAIGLLALSSGDAVPFLRDKMDPSRWKGVAQLLKELDDDRFEVREKATAELEDMGKDAAAGLREALEKRPSPEAQRRMERLLGALEEAELPPPRRRPRRDEPERPPPATFSRALAMRRGLEVLEHVGTAEARELLKTVARHAPEDALKEDARASLKRLEKRPHPPK
jgi:hypothetical protein